MASHYDAPGSVVIDKDLLPRPWFKRLGVWLSIGVLLLAIIVTVLYLGAMKEQSRRLEAHKLVTEILIGMGTHRAKITEFHARTGRLPRDAAEAEMAPPPEGVVPVEWRPVDGSLRASRLDIPGADGKSITVTLSAHLDKGTLTWNCKLFDSGLRWIRHERCPSE